MSFIAVYPFPGGVHAAHNILFIVNHFNFQQLT